MADVPDPVSCEACGRPLPPQRGNGRRRRYCDATCRSAARRERELAAGRRPPPKPAQAALTPAVRHDNVNSMAGPPGAADPVAAAVRRAARRLAGELTRPGAGSPLTAVAAARDLSAATDAALQAAVDRARAGGRSWREIGDVLGTTRQAAFQRFGRPDDPRTGQPMNREAPAGAADRAIALFACFAEGRWADALTDFNPPMRARHDADLLAGGWAHTVGMIGRFERMGEPLARRAGDDVVVDVPLHFEADEAVGTVRFDGLGQVSGLRIRPAGPSRLR